MQNIIDNFNISQLFIFNEDLSKKIQKDLKKDEYIDTDDIQMKIVISVSQKEVNGKYYHLIQYEDKKMGWIELVDSIQIYRFPAKHFQVIPEIFQPNELNEKMGISKDFIAHFQGKLLSIKSQVTYKGEVYYGVFLKNKFHGFHKASYLDPNVEVLKDIEVSDIGDDIEFYKFSNLTGEVEEIEEIESAKISSVFQQNKVAKIIINGSQNYWVSLDYLPEIDLVDLEDTIDQQTLEFNEVMYSINEERTKTKEILKSVLSAKDFVSKKGKKDNFDISSDIKITDMSEELDRYKKDNQDLSKQLDKLTKENNLANSRLEHQRDYNKRLEAQKDKYKSRMEVVEEKMKKLNDQVKQLKRK